MTNVYIAIGILVAVVLLYLLFQNGKKASLKKVVWYNNWALKMRLAHSSEKYLMAQLNTVSGKLEGCDVKIFEKITGSNNKSQYLHTFIQFEPSPFNFEFDISRKSSGGISNFEVGEASIDDLFIFVTNDADKFRNLLNSEVINNLKLANAYLGTGISADAEKFEHYFMGGLRKEEQTEELEALLNVMTALIKANK
ncbi:MAG: hypothetical protein GQ574_02935 [Crocinitomix sp.]|nr:hypothetical protein [Crocinitomix sp.]